MWSPEHGCSDKRTYFDKTEAKQFCRSLNANLRRRGEPETHVYHCPGCGHYHIGHPIGTRSGAAA